MTKNDFTLCGKDAMLKKGEIHGWPWWSGMLVIIGVPAHSEAAVSGLIYLDMLPSASAAAASLCLSGVACVFYHPVIIDFIK